LYSITERKDTLNYLTDYFNSIESIRGVVLLGSGTIGFTDAFSDLDFMLSVSKESDCFLVKELIFNKLIDLGYSFGKIVEFRNNRYIIVAILENFLELDISIILHDELVARTDQWQVLIDKDETVFKKMSDSWNNRKNDSILEIINNNNLIVETTYLIRRGLIELARNNIVYAANLISEMRENILIIECLIENKKVHQFKNYSSLDSIFIDKIGKTYVGNLNKTEILNTIIYCNDLFFNMIKDLTHDESCLKYKNILSNYIKELF